MSLRRLWALVAKDLRIRARDRKGYLLLLAMPLVLTTVLGFALGPVFRGEGLAQIPVAAVDLDGGELGRTLIDGVLRGEALAQMLQVSEGSGASDLERMREAVGRGQYAALVVVPEGFSRSAVAGRPAQLKVYTDPGQSVRAEVVRSVVDAFAAQLMRRQVAMATALEMVTVRGGLFAMLSPTLVPEVLQQVEQAAGRVELRLEKQLTAQRSRPLNAMDYYAAAMAVMFLLFSVLTVSKTLITERQDGTYPRLLMTPATRLEVLLSKLAGSFLVAVVQFIILAVTTRWLHGVVWTQSAMGLALVVAAAALAAAGWGTAIAAISRTGNSAENLGTTVIMVMSMLGGSMFPLYGMPDWLRAVSKATFNGWAMEGLLRLMFDGAGVAQVLLPAAVLAGMGVFLSGAGLLALYRR